VADQWVRGGKVVERIKGGDFAAARNNSASDKIALRGRKEEPEEGGNPGGVRNHKMRRFWGAMEGGPGPKNHPDLRC